jgi:hypothetical protein
LPFGQSTAAIAGKLGSASTVRQCFLRVFDQPLAAAAIALAAVEKGQGVEYRFQMLALLVQVALGADRFAAAYRHQAYSARGGRQARPVRTERRDHQAQ